MIRDQALQYAEQYAAQEEAQHNKGDGRSSIHYPALFLFLGDKVTPGHRSGAGTLPAQMGQCRRRHGTACRFA
ncbi:hypothetical protein ACFSQ7_45065 [Paenibacillus rhizoplanae]